MGLEEVKEEIISNAYEKASEIINQGKKEADKIIKEAENKLKGEKEKLNLELKKTKENIKKKELASSELEIKKLLLEEKKKALDIVFEDAKKKISLLSNKKRGQHIKKLIQKAQKELDIKYVYCNSKDKSFITEFEVEEIPILGGIIAENEKKDMRIDYSYDTILENVKEKHLEEIGKIMFS